MRLRSRSCWTGDNSRSGGWYTICDGNRGIYGTLDALLCLPEVKMIAVQNVSPLGSDSNFVVALLVDGKLKTYRLAVESIKVDGKTIERIVCEDELTRL